MQVHTLSYNRSPILSFYELSDAQQKYITEMYGDSEKIADDSFVLIESEFLNNDRTEFVPLPLTQFDRLEHSNIWDGVYGTSYFSYYCIKISKSGDCALVASKYC